MRGPLGNLLGGGQDQDLEKIWARDKSEQELKELEGGSSTPCTLASQGRRIASRIPPGRVNG